MANINPKIEELKRQIKSTDREIEKLRREYDGKYRAEMDRIKSEFTSKTNGMQNDMIDRFKRLESSLSEAFLYETDKMTEKYSKLEAQVKEAEKQINAELEQMLAAQRKIVAKQKQQDATLKALAESSIKDLNVSIEDACKYPVELFYPHAIQRYVDAGREAADLMSSELYSLALSKSDCAKMFVNRLADDTKAKVRELEMMLQLYGEMVETVKRITASPESARLFDDDGRLVLELTETDVDYWSDMLYTDLRALIRHHEDIVAGGVQGWLATCGSTDLSPSLLLDHEMQKLDRIPKQLKTCIIYALSACDSYNYFNTVYEVAESIFSGQNYMLESIAYGEVRSGNETSAGYDAYYESDLKHQRCVREGGRPDFREERVLTYCKKYTDGSIDRCIISMVPIRTDATVSHKLYLKCQTGFMPAIVTRDMLRMFAAAGIYIEPITDGCRLSLQANRPLSLNVLDSLVTGERESTLSSKYSKNI